MVEGKEEGDRGKLGMLLVWCLDRFGVSMATGVADDLEDNFIRCIGALLWLCFALSRVGDCQI